MNLQALIANAKTIALPAAVDDGVARLYLPSNPHARLTLHGFLAQYSAAVGAIKTVTISKTTATPSGGGAVLDDPALAIGTTDTDVASDAFGFVAARAGVYEKAAVAVGTALAAGTIPADTWGLYRFVIGADGTIDCLAAAANFTTGYASEALAIAVIPDVTADHADLGYVTVKTAVGLAFIGGTDSLKTGVAGNVASETNYYSATPLTLTQVGLPLRWDFTNGLLLATLPGPINTERDQALVLALAASGTGGTSGEIQAYVSSP